MKKWMFISGAMAALVGYLWFQNQKIERLQDENARLDAQVAEFERVREIHARHVAEASKREAQYQRTLSEINSLGDGNAPLDPDVAAFVDCMWGEQGC